MFTIAIAIVVIALLMWSSGTIKKYISAKDDNLTISITKDSWKNKKAVIKLNADIDEWLLDEKFVDTDGKQLKPTPTLKTLRSKIKV